MTISDCRRLAVLVGLILVLLISTSIIQASALSMKPVQVRGNSDGSGWAYAEATVNVLPPNALAYVVMNGWEFYSDYPSKGHINIFTQRYLGNNQWSWDLTHQVDSSGSLKFRTAAWYDRNEKKPFSVLVNYIVIVP